MRAHASHSAWLVAIALFYCLSGNIASAGTITIKGTKAASSIAGIDSDNDSTVSTMAITYVAGAPQAMKNALKAQFPTWAFNYSPGLAGTLNISTYKPVSSADDNGGAILDATYTRAGTDPTIANLHWIQLVVTNLPLGGGSTKGYIDPLPNDDTLPFYWTVPEDSSSTMKTYCGYNYVQGNKTASTYHFFDCSQRTPPSGTPTDWTGYLLLASWTDPGGNNWLKMAPPAADQKVTIYDGIEWGWTLRDDADVPEPDSVVLLLTGLIGFGLWRFLSSGNTNTGPAQRPEAT